MDLLLGELLELVIQPEDGSGLQLYQPEARWLSWDPHTRRLWSVELLEQLPDPPEGDALDLVREFHWDPADEGASWRIRRPPAGQGELLGELAAVVYAARKGSEPPAEWEHWFKRLPQVRLAGEEFQFLGRVEVTGRGITS